MLPRFLLLTLCSWLAGSGLARGAPAVPVPTVCGEAVSTAALVDNGILYAASFEVPEGGGHLRAFALTGRRQTRLWDAAERVPSPGAALPPPAAPEAAALAPPFGGRSAERLLFTSLGAADGYRLVTLDAQGAHLLQPLLGTAGVAEAAALINAVRGRQGTSAATPAGSRDRSALLGAISRSSPALVGGSPVDAAAAVRDQVLYVGAEDGLLHAIKAGAWVAAEGRYDHAAADCGRELWGYLPGSLLGQLAGGLADPAGYRSPIHVDGSPVAADIFLDGDGDGRREWRTVLVGTASLAVSNQGVVFAFDVTDPHRPRLLWESALPGAGLGRSRGAALTVTAGWTDAPPRVFLTAGTATRVNRAGAADPAGAYGCMACALDLATGTLLWRFAAPYPPAAADLVDAPSAPAVMSAAAGGGVDGILFGDLAGRLWSLDPASGAPLGGGPAWQSPGGADEPIGGGFAIRNRLALFGTGGVGQAAPDRSYAVYAVELLPEGGRLLWAHPLEPGEIVWGAPTLDRFGRAFVGVGDEPAQSGRVLVLEADGSEAGSVALAGPPGGGVILVPGAIVTVSSAGVVEQIGEIQLDAAPAMVTAGRVRLFSWRVR